MLTLEQKVDLMLCYILTEDKRQQNEIRKNLLAALDSGEMSEYIVAPTPAAPDVEEMIVEMFKEIGMPQRKAGYKYAVTAIELCVENPECIRCISKGLYPVIAEKYNTTTARVEKNIRHTIEVTFNRGDIDNFTKIFGNTIDIRKGKITNSEFFAFCSNEIIRKLKRLEAVK